MTKAKAKAPTKAKAPAKAKAKEETKEKAPVKTVVRVAPRKELTAESMYEQFRGAKISDDRLQPTRSSSIYVEIENKDEEIETHLIDMRQCPADIVDSFVE